MQNIPDFSEIMRLAQTPEGRRLITLLQNTDSTLLNSALSNAKSGNMDAARDALSGILGTAEAQALLKQLGR